MSEELTHEEKAQRYRQELLQEFIDSKLYRENLPSEARDRFSQLTEIGKEIFASNFMLRVKKFKEETWRGEQGIQEEIQRELDRTPDQLKSMLAEQEGAARAWEFLARKK